MFRGYKKNSSSTRLSKKFILLINVQNATSVGILTFLAWFIQHLRDLKQETSLLSGVLVFMSIVEISCSVGLSSVVECLTRDREAAGSSLTCVTALWSLSKIHLS